jgi:hypothetical protein
MSKKWGLVKQEIAQEDAFLLYGIVVKLMYSRKNRYKRPIF